MFNRRMGLLGLMSASLAGAAMAIPSAFDVRPAAPGLRQSEGVTRYRRGKGKQARPRKRPNMRHVSKRVRRKHRRNR